MLTTFLRDLATLAARALLRPQAAGGPLGSASRFEENHNLVTLALTGSGTGLWDRDVVTGEIHYSPAWKALLGYGPHELSTRIEDAYERVHPADLAHVQATMQAHFDNKTDSYAVEHRIRRKDGSYIWICSRGKVVSRDSEGRAQRMVGTSTDITALRETAESLQHTIDLITNLTNEVPGLVFQYRLGADGRGAFPYASDGIRDVYELTPADVMLSADAIEARIDPRDIAAYRRSLRDSAANLTPWHLEYRVNLPRQGTCWRQGDARPQRMPDGSTLWHGFISDATDRKRIEAELQELATIDHLTQLPNRRHFTFQSEAELTRLRNAETGIAAVLMLDLDHFKALNDRWGHALGDRALSHFAQLLRAEARIGDLVGRIGGEEFAVVLPHASTDEAIAFAQRVQRRIDEAPLVDGGLPIALTVSIGIDGMRSTDAGAYQALSRCDKALYVAKERGRNRIEIYEEQ
ncbi:diguanylate cyclase [Trinickia sp.]|uniref:sensor domain-containing diguanylate cyclase n=1 Tax=Trinickia sp. TaxID=2571163 RepID=UPI003F7E6FF0